MPAISFNYLYRDYGNFKRFGSVLFSNPNQRTLAEIDTAIRTCLWDDSIFYAHIWKVPHLFFPENNAELDHAFHEYESVEEAKSSAHALQPIDEFLSLIQSTFKPLI